MNEPQKRKRGRPINQERRKLEAKLGYTGRHVRRVLEELGADKITDHSELKLLERQVTIAFRHIRGQREALDFEAAKRRLISTDEVLELGRKIGNIFEQVFGELLQTGPADLAGRSESEIYESLKRTAVYHINQFRAEVTKLEASKK